MTITAVVFDSEEEAASVGIGDSSNTRTEVYKVLSDSLNEDMYNVLAASGLPVPGVTVASHTNKAICLSLSAKRWQKDTRQLFRVQADYGTPSGDEDAEIYPPTNRPTVFNFPSSTKTEFPIVQDRITGDYILLPNGRPFSEPITTPLNNSVFTAQRYESSFSIAVKSAYEDHVNSSTFLGLAARSVRCSSITGTQEMLNNGAGVLTAYYNVLYTFEFNPLLWNPSQFIAQDIMEVFTFPFSLVKSIQPIKDAFGQNIKEPQFLNSAGEAITIDEILAGTETPYIIEASTFLEANFTALSL